MSRCRGKKKGVDKFSSTAATSRTISPSTAPRTPRRTCCPYAYVLITVLCVSRSCCQKRGGGGGKEREREKERQKQTQKLRDTETERHIDRERVRRARERTSQTSASRHRFRVNMAHIRQSRPSSGLDVQGKAPQNFQGVPS